MTFVSFNILKEVFNIRGCVIEHRTTLGQGNQHWVYGIRS